MLLGGGAIKKGPAPALVGAEAGYVGILFNRRIYISYVLIFVCSGL